MLIKSNALFGICIVLYLEKIHKKNYLKDREREREREKEKRRDDYVSSAIILVPTWNNNSSPKIAV